MASKHGEQQSDTALRTATLITTSEQAPAPSQ
jgi:hypothetical protein